MGYRVNSTTHKCRFPLFIHSRNGSLIKSHTWDFEAIKEPLVSDSRQGRCGSLGSPLSCLWGSKDHFSCECGEAGAERWGQWLPGSLRPHLLLLCYHGLLSVFSYKNLCDKSECICLLITAVLQFNPSAFRHIYTVMIFSLFIKLCNHHPCLITENVHRPERNYTHWVILTFCCCLFPDTF